MDEKTMNKALYEALATPSDVDQAWSDQCAQRLIGRAQLLDEQANHHALFRRRAGVCIAITIIVSWLAVAIPSVLVRTAAPVQAAAATMLKSTAGTSEKISTTSPWMQLWHHITLQTGGGIEAVSSGPMHGTVRVYVSDSSWLLVERRSGNVLGAVTQSMPLVAKMTTASMDMGFSQLEQIRTSVNTALMTQSLSLQAAGLQQPPVYDLRTSSSEQYATRLVFVRLAGSDGTGGAVVNIETMRIVTVCDCSQASGLLVTDSGVVVVSQ
jgi:hypothetical protein